MELEFKDPFTSKKKQCSPQTTNALKRSFECRTMPEMKKFWLDQKIFIYIKLQILLKLHTYINYFKKLFKIEWDNSLPNSRRVIQHVENTNNKPFLCPLRLVKIDDTIITQNQFILSFVIIWYLTTFERALVLYYFSILYRMEKCYLKNGKICFFQPLWKTPRWLFFTQQSNFHKSYQQLVIVSIFYIFS